MNFETLFHANFSLLDDAVTDWATLVRNLGELKKDAETNLHQAASKANWAGMNQQVSKEFIGKTAGEFADAHTQASTIHQVLSDTLGELRGYHRQLTTAVENGRKRSLSVFPSGDAFMVTSSVPPQTAAAGEPDRTADVTALRDEIQSILDKATESDNSAGTVLKALADQSELGFSDARYKDRDSAAKAIADAQAMAKILAKDPHDVSNTELNTLNTTLAKYKGDALFTERFTTEVGAKKLLTFYAGVADPYPGTYDPRRSEQAKQLQKNLGNVVGQATLSDSEKMRAWKSDMIALGQGQLGIDDASNPTGFVVMSNLMRFGDYDDQFLNDYGDKLLAYDKKVNGEGINLWVNNANQSDLNYWGYKNDRGRDPVTGFLEALGHNPGASSEFFALPGGAGATVNAGSEVNEHLSYLAKERVWASDTTLEGKHGYVAGRDSLGHALEAATTGFPYDTTADVIKTSGEHRTRATAAVMEQVAYLYSSADGPKMLHSQPELADSLGKMAGAYIDDIDYHLSGVGDYEKDDATFPEKYAGRANFTQQGAINFLSVLGQDENSHRAVTAAQHLYMLSALDAYPPSSDTTIEHAHDALTTGAQARGILDNSRVQQAETTYKEESDEANKSLGRSGDWIKLGVGTTVGVGIGAIPLPGSTAAAVVIAPVAADTVGEAVNTFIGHQIDKGLEDEEKDPAEKSQLTSSEFYAKGETQLGNAYHTYVSGSPEATQKANVQNWNADIKNAYLGVGSHENDYRGRTPYKD
ncbi:hypothetical protein OG739_26640 [Streptomyces longwoodensis]|uniref:hypothetical protein n=1 Tax=Streptomyces longwoodensis TaxID=68231 RepID=UPI00324DB2FD